MKGKSMSWLHTEKTACQEGGTYIFISEKNTILLTDFLATTLTIVLSQLFC
jgi:hypothetical protein